MSDVQDGAVEIDDDDWIEIEKEALASVVKHEVSVRVSAPREGVAGMAKAAYRTRAKASITFRNAAAEWVESHNRFRVKIGGQFANKIRLESDDSGPFETLILRGVSILKIGVISAWSVEGRAPTKAQWTVTPTTMTLTLPADWAISSRAA